MTNEILLILSLIIIYGSVLIFYKLFNTTGMYAWTAFATVIANIEVLIMINAFSLEQTLGNVMFASTFVVTDILSENHGKKYADKAVALGIGISVMFIIVTRFWLLFTPSENDFTRNAFETIFSNTPRIMLAGFSVYVLAQILDVWLYHKIWSFTEKKSGGRKKFLWLRNNVATLISQLVNAVFFNLIAFWGIYDNSTLLSIIISTYVIYAVAAFLDTPIVYWSRKIALRNNSYK